MERDTEDEIILAAANGRSVQPTCRENGKGCKRRVEQEELTKEYHKELLVAMNNTLDEDEHFFMSLIPATKRLSPRKRANIKLKFMQILIAAEFGDVDQV